MSDFHMGQTGLQLACMAVSLTWEINIVTPAAHAQGGTEGASPSCHLGLINGD